MLGTSPTKIAIAMRADDPSRRRTDHASPLSSMAVFSCRARSDRRSSTASCSNASTVVPWYSASTWSLCNVSAESGNGASPPVR